MAGDWIHMREDLHEDPSVLMMARELGTRPEHIVGYCHRFWSWVSRQCNDGSVTNVTPEDIESVLNLPGFCRMLVRAGWLECHESNGSPSIAIPKFERWLSQGSKARRLTSERQRKWRNARVTEMSHEKCNKSATREEKRREEKSKKNKPPFIPPLVSEVRDYCQDRGNQVDAQKFVDFYQSKGWKVGKAPMKDWRASVRTWERGSESSTHATIEEIMGGSQ